ncbi:hypothetical protein Tco_0486063, partial [Tanacetum coccineum]
MESCHMVRSFQTVYEAQESYYRVLDKQPHYMHHKLHSIVTTLVPGNLQQEPR